MAGRSDAAIGWALAFALCANGCGDQSEGVLLVISADQGSDSSFLKVGAGSPIPGVLFADVDQNTPITHIHDELNDGLIVLGGRDLARDPFRYFIRGGGESEIDLVVLAITKSDDGDAAPTMLAHLPSVVFESGVVKQYDIHLDPVAPEGDSSELNRVGNTCVRASVAGDAQLIVTSGTDFDCDGWEVTDPRGPSDCAPMNGFIHPEAIDTCEPGRRPVDNNCDGRCDEDDSDGGPLSICNTVVDECSKFCPVEPADGIADSEICDGLDSDCNPQTVPHDSQTPCFADNDDGCAFGARPCDDQEAGETENCQVSEPMTAVPAAFCAAYAACDNGVGSAIDCAYKSLGQPTVHCSVGFSADEGLCSFRAPIDANGLAGDGCRLDVLDARNEPFAIATIGGTTPGCVGRSLNLQQAGGGDPASFELLLRASLAAEVEKFLRVTLDVYEVERCNANSPPFPACDGALAF